VPPRFHAKLGCEESSLRHRRNSTPLKKARFKNFYPVTIRHPTHTDKGHVHNHIALNHRESESGKRIQNKKSVIQYEKPIVTNFVSSMVYQSLIPVIWRQGSLAIQSEQMVRFNRSSYLYDLAQRQISPPLLRLI